MTTTTDMDFILFDNKCARKPELWQFIKMIAPSNQPKPCGGWTSKECIGLYCIPCKMQLKYVANDSKILRRHMNNIHQKELMAFEALHSKASKRVMTDFLSPTQKKTKSAAGYKEKQKLKMLCANWITKHCRSIQIVDDECFRDIIEYVNEMKNAVELPGRTCVAEEISKQAEQRRIALKEIIKKDAYFYCMTTDIWSSRSLTAFLSLTMHYLARDFTMKCWNLEVKKFGGKHTGQRIAEFLNNMLMHWNLKKNRMVLMIRDNASNGVSATNLLDVPSLGCIPHQLHLVLAPLFFPTKKHRDINTFVTVQQMESFELNLDRQEKHLIQELGVKIKTMRALAKYFCKSNKGAEKLRLLQSGRPLGCILDVVTRWSSSCKMLERLVQLRAPIESFLAYCSTPAGKFEFPDFNKESPTAEDWFVVEGLTHLLKPFESATAILSGEKYCTLAQAFPVLRFIKRKVSDTAIFDSVQEKYESLGMYADLEFLKGIQQYLLRHFCERFSKVPIYMVAASVLHPGYSKMTHLKNEEKLNAQEFIISEMVTLNSKTLIDEYDDDTDVPVIECIDVSSPLSCSSTEEIMRELQGTDNDFADADEINIDMVQEEANLKIHCLSEFKLYLELAKLYIQDKSKKKCPLLWWRKQSITLKLLAPVARKWLGCIASSVPSERAFSSAGNTVTAKRASLGDDMVRDILFLHENDV